MSMSSHVIIVYVDIPFKFLGSSDKFYYVIITIEGLMLVTFK